MSQDSNVHALRLWPTAPPGVYIAGNACIVCNRSKNIISFPVSVAVTIPLDVVTDKTARDEAAGLSHEGILGICAECIKRAAKLVGWADAKESKQAVKDAKEQVVRMEAELFESETMLSAYKSLVTIHDAGPKQEQVKVEAKSE